MPLLAVVQRERERERDDLIARNGRRRKNSKEERKEVEVLGKEEQKKRKKGKKATGLRKRRCQALANGLDSVSRSPAISAKM